MCSLKLGRFVVCRLKRKGIGKLFSHNSTLSARKQPFNRLEPERYLADRNVLVMLTFSGKWALRAGLRVVFREQREAHDRTTARWPAAPWMLARAFAKHVKDCQRGFYREQRDAGSS